MEEFNGTILNQKKFIMKTICKIIPVFALLFLANLSFAQIKFNPRIGFNASALNTELDNSSTDLRFGYNIGADFRIGSHVLYAQPGFHYYNFTARLVKKEDASNIQFKDETVISAIKVPLNAGLRLTGKGGLLRLYAKGGLTPTFVTGVDAKPNFNFSKDQVHNFSWGANVGGGLDILIFNFDVNYEWGLSDFFTDQNGRNKMLTMSFGLIF